MDYEETHLTTDKRGTVCAVYLLSGYSVNKALQMVRNPGMFSAIAALSLMARKASNTMGAQARHGTRLVYWSTARAPPRRALLASAPSACLPRLHEEREIWGEGEVVSTTIGAAAGRGPSQGGQTRGMMGDSRSQDKGSGNVAGVFTF